MMKGTIHLRYLGEDKVHVFDDSSVKIKSISRHVMNDRIEIKYVFTSSTYVNIAKLINFLSSSIDREIHLYVDDHLMNEVNTSDDYIFIQEFNNGVDYTAELSWFKEV